VRTPLLKSRLNEINEYFATTGRNLAHRKLEDMTTDTQTLMRKAGSTFALASSMFVSPTSENEVLLTISTIKEKSSEGIDGISPKLLHACKHLLAKPLAYIFNLSIVKGVFPDSANIF
jgi:hypothetical protein